MNAEEARKNFRSATGPERGLAPELTLDETKKRFRSAASELDNSLGLSTEEPGVWSAALFCIATLLGMGRTQSWLDLLLSGLGNFGGKALDAVLALFVEKSEEKKRARRAKKKQDTKG